MSRTVRNPPQRFESWIEWDVDPPHAQIELIPDATRSILARNDSPDVPFEWSVNPYRGCVHACAYCYARGFHEYLGMGAGTDFETRIVVKYDAANLLVRAFRSRSWRGERLVFSGVTDCYQPIEHRLGLTRGCLEVCLQFRNPVSVITRSAVIERDAELLAELHRAAGAAVSFSIPLLDTATARAVEPFASTPLRRLRSMSVLADAGVPVGVSIAPIIPGLSDREIPDILRRARDAGATWAHCGLLRLPGAVARVFEERLRATMPDRIDAILARTRRAHGGTLQGSCFGDRMTGRGPVWEATARLFQVWRARLGYGTYPETREPTPFRRPTPQLPLF